MILVATDSKGKQSLISGDPTELRQIIARAKGGDWPGGDVVSLESYKTREKLALRPASKKAAKKTAKVKTSYDPPG